jgi:Fur family transcriptional regulator, peroxide stress response regulator
MISKRLCFCGDKQILIHGSIYIDQGIKNNFPLGIFFLDWYLLFNNYYLLIMIIKKHIDTKQIQEILSAKNLRVTWQRIIIMKELLGRGDHPRAEDIFKKLKKDYPTLSLSTVYKTLDLFSKHALIKKINTSDESFHYDADSSFHHHLICTKSNTIRDYEDDKLASLILDYLAANPVQDFNIHEIRLKIFGETI